jgi:carbon storage regulator CsrA
VDPLKVEWLFSNFVLRSTERSPLMLVLSRRPGQSILLPGLGVTVRVLSAKGGTVRIGIEAPPDVKVLREELVCPADGEREAARRLAEPAHA